MDGDWVEMFLILYRIRAQREFYEEKSKAKQRGSVVGNVRRLDRKHRKINTINKINRKNEMVG